MLVHCYSFARIAVLSVLICVTMNKQKRSPSLIKIVTYNMQVGVATTRGYWHYATSFWKHLLPHSGAAVEDIAHFVRSEAIDIAVFTEIDGGSYRTLGVNQVKRIAKLTGLDESSFLPTYRFSRFANHGNGICSKYPILKDENHKLPGNGHPRYLGVADIKIDGQNMAVMVTHLSLGEAKRKEQMEYIGETVRSTEGPVMLTGDFNTENASEIGTLLDGTRLRLVANHETYPSWRAKRSLDYLFLSPEISFVEAYAPDDVRLSDHLPLVAKVFLN